MRRKKTTPLAELQFRLALRPKDVEVLYGISRASLKVLRAQNRGPEYTQKAKRSPVFYTHEAIRQYLGLTS